MAMKISTKIRKGFEKDLANCKNINELVWIYTDMAQNMALSCDDLLSLIRNYETRRTAFEKDGDKYRRATRPEFRK